jgi:hypothetical protein
LHIRHLRFSFFSSANRGRFCYLIFVPGVPFHSTPGYNPPAGGSPLRGFWRIQIFPDLPLNSSILQPHQSSSIFFNLFNLINLLQSHQSSSISSIFLNLINLPQSFING